jgi:hypothetical protein
MESILAKHIGDVPSGLFTAYKFNSFACISYPEYVPFPNSPSPQRMMVPIVLSLMQVLGVLVQPKIKQLSKRKHILMMDSLVLEENVLFY